MAEPTTPEPETAVVESAAEAPRRLRIALVTNRFYPEVGGAETNIYFQACELVKYYDVTVFTPRRLEDSPEDEEINGFRVRRLTDVLHTGKPFPNLASNTLCPAIFDEIRSGKFDVMHCFPSLTRNNTLAALGAKLSGAARVLVSFDFRDYAALIQERGEVYDMLADFRPALEERLGLKLFQHVFTISERETEFLSDYCPSVCYSPVPVKPEEYDDSAPPNPREAAGISKGDFVFLSLGRVSNVKGQDLAVNAFLQAADDLPKSHLVVVGRTDYEPEFFAKMQAAVAASPHGERVHFTGMVDREDVLGWLKYSDIHVVPVRFMNSGAVVVESWISGTPVIQSHVVDPNLVVEGENGFLFPSQDVPALADKMREAKSRKSELGKMAKAGDKLVRERFTYPYLISLYRQKYEELCGV